MPDHLLLPERIPLGSRRQGGGGGPGTPPRNPHRHGEQLKQQLGRALDRLRPIRIVEGVDPARVFKITAKGRIVDQTWSAKELQFLGETADWTYFVLSPGQEPERLIAQLDSYAQAPDVEGAHGPNYTFFDGVEAIEPYGPEDRRGPGLPLAPDTLTEPIVVDVVAWPSDGRQEAEQRLQQIRRIVEHHNGEEIAFDARARYTVLRTRISSSGLADLLELAVVERIRTPPIAYLEPSDWLAAPLEDLAVEPHEGVPIGIIDDGIAAHPLLDGLVASRRSFPADHAWQPIGQHGTMVAGLALFGEFESSLRERRAFRPRGVVHQARVLEPDPRIARATRFAPSMTAHQAIEQAIETLHGEEGVRVFNLSINDPDAYSGPHVGLITERLDELIRELNIVVAVSAGNHGADMRNGEMDSGHHAANAYPMYLMHPSARIAEPATAALALSVGALTRFDAPQTHRGDARVGDHAIAAAREIAPFSRTGPGAFKGVKPEVLDIGGNWVITDTGTLDAENPGVGVISLGVNQTGRLFSLATGTSFAAPRVARLAAAIWDAYPDASANLIRALVGIASRVPEPVSNQFQDADERLRAAGYGQPHEELATASGGPRVVMIFDGELPTDTAAIHPIPIPDAFARGRADRRIAVALAYDPPVRRQRRDYLAGEMTFDLLRNVSDDDVRQRYERQGAKRVSLYTGKREKLDLRPGTQATNNSTLICRSVEPQTLDPDDGDAYYLAVSHVSAQWADAGDQRYALAVELVEHERLDIDLYAAVQAQARVRARVRLRG
jgi:hypothetical protein